MIFELLNKCFLLERACFLTAPSYNGVWKHAGTYLDQEVAVRGRRFKIDNKKKNI